MRVNQNPHLTLYTILFIRLHNYLADKLCKLNPHWKDETVYQETRRIVWAVVEHITYKQYLPILLGEEFMYRKGLLVEGSEDRCQDYFNPKVNPSTFAEWAGAAFRATHSTVPNELVFFEKDYTPYDVELLKDFFLRPYILDKPGNLDALTRGLVAQPQESQDLFYSVAMTQFLRKDYNRPYGQDIGSFDVQRGRDKGLPIYNDFRELCGFPRAYTFQDLADFMSEESIQKLEETYKSVDDIDLYIGGLLEELIPGTLVGPTFQCINGEQFFNWMRGDRWFYENCGSQKFSFSQEQIQALYATTPAWIMCVAGDNIKSVTQDTFRLPSEQNPLVSCDDIPSLDLTPWKQSKDDHYFEEYDRSYEKDYDLLKSPQNKYGEFINLMNAKL